MLRQLFDAAGSRRRAIDVLVRHVAEASVEAVRTLVIDRVAGMSPCEARGYIRARAGLELRRQARAAVARHPECEPAWESLVARHAADRIAPLVMRRLAAHTPPARRVA